MHTLGDWQKSVIVDRMYITENLVYDKHTGTLISFIDYGEVNEHLLRFKHDIIDISHVDKTLAKSMTFIV